MHSTFRYHSEITQRSEIASTVPLATAPTAPCFLFLLFSALLSSWSLIYDIEFDSNYSCLDRLNNVSMISSQKLQNLPQNAISRIVGTLMCKSGELEGLVYKKHSKPIINRVQNSTFWALITPPNLHIASPLAMKERKKKRTYKTITK